MNKKILEFLIGALHKNEPCVLLTVVASDGHSPGREGFAMAVTKDELLGTVGGGAIEKNMVNTARKFISKSKTVPEIFHREHKISAKKNSSGMICGGMQSVVAYPFWSHIHLQILNRCLTAYEGDSKPKVFQLSSVGIGCLDEERAAFCSFSNFRDSVWMYEEVIGQKDTAYIFGGGHVCLALSPILASLGFRIAVLDERPHINTLCENKFINELFISPFVTLSNMIAEGEHSYVFIMTPSHTYDEIVLRGLLNKNLKYLGMMASKTKVAEIFARLKKEGFSEDSLALVRAPIGISIKSRTPEEIAISIAAEVIKVKNTS
jgi:xanthine dehydrogenase accessory factor